MSVDGIGTTSAVGFANFSAMSGSLTPDALMEYAQTQLGSIDSSINQLMSQQNAAAKATTSLSDVASELQKYPDGFNTIGRSTNGNAGATALPPNAADTTPPGGENAADVNTAVLGSINAAIADTSDPGTLTALNDLKTKWTNTFNDDGNVSQVEMGQFTDQIKDIQSDASTNQQMAMIQIQSLVSQRQQAIQMTSSMMQTLNDSTKSVIGNINQ